MALPFRVLPASFLCFLFVLILGCGDKNGSHKTICDSVAHVRDSAGNPKAPTALDSLSFSGEDTNAVYAAFELSSKTQAFVITAWFDFLRNANDSFLRQLVFKDGYFRENDPELGPMKNIADTSGRFPLLESPEAAAKFEYFLTGEFYICCTKNVVKRKISRVLFSANTCNSSFFAFQFDPVDPEKDGHPLLASRRRIESPYANPAAEKAINRFNDSLIRAGRDYTDSLHLHVFAQRDDSLFFIYSDDFHWAFMQEDRKCFFPGRYLVVIRPRRKIEYKWTEELDLFGVPCD